MPNPFLKRFVVEGAGTFPFDLLRIDQCWPASPRDAVSLAPDGTSTVRSVTLETAAKYAPDRQGWARSGWRVSD